jgi:hypothetical protein
MRLLLPAAEKMRGIHIHRRSKMLKQILITTLFFTAASSAIAAAHATMAGLSDPNDPRVKEAYTAQCNEWAGQTTFENEQAKDTYMNNCVSDMAQVWPVGMDESE